MMLFLKLRVRCLDRRERVVVAVAEKAYCWWSGGETMIKDAIAFGQHLGKGRV
jgi:hypothetical protein